MSDETIDCALCGKTVFFAESYSPADEAICAECDTEVTGRKHPPLRKGMTKGQRLIAFVASTPGGLRLKDIQGEILRINGRGPYDRSFRGYWTTNLCGSNGILKRYCVKRGTKWTLSRDGARGSGLRRRAGLRER